MAIWTKIAEEKLFGSGHETQKLNSKTHGEIRGFRNLRLGFDEVVGEESSSSPISPATGGYGKDLFRRCYIRFRDPEDKNSWNMFRQLIATGDSPIIVREIPFDLIVVPITLYSVVTKKETKVMEESLLSERRSESGDRESEKWSSYQYVGRTGSVIPTASLKGTEVSVDEIRSAASSGYYPPSIHAPLVSAPESDHDEQATVCQSAYGGEYSSNAGEFQSSKINVDG
ncbi:protein SSUH2 isoform X1 [Tripterygium wilfordii]|uniref:Protein SSUH2 isoform X1 n=1 Tax=Tripterygium wilfordii TaxID=458696 RepID=A0A7J7CSX6_TRIWF|nr:protein SSUH2 isoform X1 [Tripterygium wilfordii]